MKITVTGKHIIRGIQTEPLDCPIAIALNEQFPTCEAAVGTAKIVLFPLLAGPYSEVELPIQARRFVRSFDFWGGWLTPRWWKFWLPKEYVFDIPVPEELVTNQRERTSVFDGRAPVAASSNPKSC